MSPAGFRGHLAVLTWGGLSMSKKTVFASQKLLDVDQEYDLAVRAMDGDLEARNLLVEMNLRYAKKIAGKYRNKKTNFEELFSAACFGLLVASVYYRPNMETRFVVYASRAITQAVIKEMSFYCHSVSMSQEDKKIVKMLNQELEKCPESKINWVIENFIRQNDWDGERVRKLHKAGCTSVLSIDSGLEDSEDDGWVKDTTLISPEDLAERNMDFELVLKEINRLPKKDDRRIMSMLYGLNGYRQMSGTEIGEIFGKTKAWVSQVKAKCLAYIRKEIGEEDCAA